MDLVIDASEKATQIPAVQPVLVVVVGSTMAEAVLILHAQMENLAEAVPWRAVVVDSIPYSDMINRQVQNGWHRNYVEDTISPSQYLEIKHPFSRNFNFKAALNRRWSSVIFDPSLEKVAKRSDAAGAAGVPAMGRARGENNVQEIRQFLQENLNQLTRVCAENMALQEGILVQFVTTGRGGTGTGATPYVAAILRSLLTPISEIHLHIVMPCVYHGDDQAYANAYAMAREQQWHHRLDGVIHFSDGTPYTAPFDFIQYVFVYNGSVSLDATDALMHVAAILRSYLRVSTQRVIKTREINLNVQHHDHLSQPPLPTHIRIETAVSVRMLMPEMLPYLAFKWIQLEVERAGERFEGWHQNRSLSAVDEGRLDGLVSATVGDLNLGGALLDRIDPPQNPTNEIRVFFDKAYVLISSMKSKTIRESVTTLLGKINADFDRYTRSWAEQSRQLARKLPQQITEYLTNRLAGSPHLALAVLEKLIIHLTELAGKARQQAGLKRKERDALDSRMASAVNDVRGAGGFFSGFVPGLLDEVTRTAVSNACATILQWALARADQERLEYLTKAIDGEMTATNSQGKAEFLPSITEALKTLGFQLTTTIRERQKSQLEEVQLRLETLGRKIQKHSQHFQKSLLYSNMDRSKLDELAAKLREQQPDVVPISRMLEGRPNLDQTVAELIPLLPFYSDTARRLADIIQTDPGKAGLVFQLLHDAKPFTPLDNVIEDQLGLKNQRDSLTVLELPGGQDSPLAELFIRKGIVPNRNQIVDSVVVDEIRLHYLRVGLPYAVVGPFQNYKKLHDHYVKKSGSTTPYTLPDHHKLPEIEPPRTNLRDFSASLLHATIAVLPHCVRKLPSGDFVLCCRQPDGFDSVLAPEQTKESFRDFNTMLNWLARRPDIRQELRAELITFLNKEPDAYRAALLAAWQKAAGEERHYLGEALAQLKGELLGPANLDDIACVEAPQGNGGSTQ